PLLPVPAQVSAPPAPGTAGGAQLPRVGMDRPAVSAGHAVRGRGLYQLRAAGVSGGSGPGRARVRVSLLRAARRAHVRGVLAAVLGAKTPGSAARLGAAALSGIHVRHALLERNRDVERVADQVAPRLRDGAGLGTAAHQVLTRMTPTPRALPSLIRALLLAPAVALGLPPLEQLETRIELSPAAQLAERAYESTRDSLSASRIGLGVSAFGSVGYGHNHDIIDPQHSWTYNQGMAGGGLSVPVLGSRLQLEDSLSEQQVQLLQLDARRELQRRELVARLRKAYGDYWQGQRLELLARNYLQDEPTLGRVVELRTRAGLLLDADRLELLSGFSLARRDVAAGGADREVALALMRELTGQALDGGIAVRPPLPTACVRNLDASDDWADSDPELVGLRKVVALRETNPRDNALYPVQSNVQLGYQTREDMPTGQHGGSAVLSWSFQVPVEYGSQRRLLARAAAAQLSRARLEYDIRRQELRQQRRELIARTAVLEQSAQFAAARLAAADAAVQVRSLRAVKLEGDVAEQLQRARIQHYGAAKALVEADRALVYWYADWA